MRILFAISLVALAALLWASVSIAQHIYRSRKQQDDARELKRKSKDITALHKRPTEAQLSTEVHDQNTQRRKAS